ncbi:MAG: hypothetical protein ABFS09_13770 [Thermodesulfobacteriota bacterium]
MKKPLLLAILCGLTVAAGAGLAAPALSALEQFGRHLHIGSDQSPNSTASCSTCHSQQELLPD